jgi:hypothetical protein
MNPTRSTGHFSYPSTYLLTPLRPPPIPRTTTTTTTTNHNNSFQLEISGIPAENAKCRVETQLKITLCIKDARGEIAQQWKQFRLPRDLIAKEKHRIAKYNGMFYSSLLTRTKR